MVAVFEGMGHMKYLGSVFVPIVNNRNTRELGDRLKVIGIYALFLFKNDFFFFVTLDFTLILILMCPNNTNEIKQERTTASLL